MSGLTDMPVLTEIRKYLLFVGALAIALCAGLYLWYAPKHDRPSKSRVKVYNGDIVLLGRKGKLTLECECPPYLIAQRSRNLTFHAELTLAKEAEPDIYHPELKPNETIELEVRSAGSDTWEMLADAMSLESQLQTSPDSGLKIPQSITLLLKPGDSDSSEIQFKLMDYLENERSLQDAATVNWEIPTHLPLGEALRPFLYSVITFVMALLLLYLAERKYRLLRKEAEQRCQKAKADAEKYPDQVSPAWELAGANLQSYFSRNLAQVRQIFDVSVGVMLVGFIFVVYGVYRQVLADPGHIAPATWIASVSGIITQFIGATFMVIYRSTIAQANEFVTVLDRINTVGIAMKVLDQIKEEDPGKNDGRRQLIGLLLGAGTGGTPFVTNNDAHESASKATPPPLLANLPASQIAREVVHH